MPGFGRLPAPDPRDYPMRAAGVHRALPTKPKYWNGTMWQGDQGSTSSCVGHAWATWWHDGPVTHKPPRPNFSPFELYARAQQLDEWPGEDYEGTSVRAGAKAMQEAGRVTAYFWTQDLNEVANAVATKGPVIVGTDWTDGMMRPNSVGRIRATGPIVGGHAYVLNGIHPGRRLFRIHNSWSSAWGEHPPGHAYIGFDDMQALLANDGDAVLAIEKR